MVLLLNVESGRELREGDEVRAAVGLRKGSVGKIVGFDLLSDEPAVVQYPALRKGVVREQFGANDVELVRSSSVQLEPLPEVAVVLQERKVSESYRTCGAMLCLRLQESGDTLTLVPKGPGVSLKTMVESSLAEENTFEESVMLALREAFVTRLPHFVDFGLSKNIDAIVEREVSTDEALDWLLNQLES